MTYNNQKELNIIHIIKDIESGSIAREVIIKKYNITSYKYYKILKEADIKNSYNELKRKPKQTAFKKLMSQNIQSENKFDIEDFKIHCKSGLKISELMEKYGLSLYQIRELRKRYELKTK